MYQITLGFLTTRVQTEVNDDANLFTETSESWSIDLEGEAFPK